MFELKKAKFILCNRQNKQRITMTIKRKHDLRHIEDKKNALRSPTDKTRTLRLYKHQATLEMLADTIEQLRNPECEIERLELVKVRFNEKLASRIAEGLNLAHCPVKELIFRKCKLKNGAMKIAMQSLNANSNVQVLEFHSQFIYGKEASEISEMLKVNTNISQLTLYNCGLVDDAMSQLSAGLGLSKHIKYLDLRRNQFEARGITALMNTLKTTCVCETLLLEDLEIGEGGEIAAIMELFKDSRCKITQLSLNALEINENTSLKLLDSIKQLSNLTNFSYAMNNCSAKFFQQFTQDSPSDQGGPSNQDGPSKHGAEKDLQYAKENSDEKYKFEKPVQGITSIDGIEKQSSSSDQSSYRDKDEFEPATPEIKPNEPATPEIKSDESKAPEVKPNVTPFSKLTVLDLSHCNITDALFEEFNQQLKKMKLQELNLAWNQLTSDSCKHLRILLEENPALKKLCIQHNNLGGKRFHLLTSAIEYHTNLTYLDVSYNNIFNEGFQLIFFPISRNKNKMEQLHSRGNGIGGKAMDRLLFTNSRYLKVLNLANNTLSEHNGNILLDVANRNPQLEQIIVDGNAEITADIIQIINNECRQNMQIKEYILPRLPKAEDTGFQHKSVTNNCYQYYDVTEVAFTDMHFYKLDFVAKFMLQNKESLEKLYLKNVQIEARGIALTNVLRDKVNKIDLKSIHIENVNLNERGLKQMIIQCKRMKNLRELALIGVPGVANSMLQIEKSFKQHLSLELLDLRNNKLPNFDSVVKILQNNKHISKINLKGTEMTPQNLAYIWLGLKENIKITAIEYQGLFTAIDAMLLLENEITLNQEIRKKILPKVKGRPNKHPNLELNDVQLSNIESVIKYVQHERHLKSIDLSFTSVTLRSCEKLARIIATREIHHINSLNLSRNLTINDEICKVLTVLFTSKSNVKHLYLDYTEITEKGVATLVQSIAENLKVQTLSFTNCRVKIYDQNMHPEWDTIIETLQQNCSLTKLNLAKNDTNPLFLQQVQVDLEKNVQIVDVIFPKLLEQENVVQKALKEKKALMKKHLFKKQKTGRQRVATVHQKKSHASDLLDHNLAVGPLQIPSILVIPSNPIQSARGLSSVPDSAPDSHHLMAVDMKRISDEANQDNNSLQDILDKELDMRNHGHQSNRGSNRSAPSNESDHEASVKNSSVGSVTASITGETGYELSLKGMKLDNLAFLVKFMSQFKKIRNVDIGETQVQKDEMDELTKVIKDNPCIQEFKADRKNVSRKTQKLMQEELAKNKEIQKYGEQTSDGFTGDRQSMKQLDLVGKQINVQAVTKMIRDYSALETLNLAKNEIGNHGALEIAALLDENNTIKKLILRDCKIGNAGLQEICSALCTNGNENLEYLDIRGNVIPDKQLKMLLILMYRNRNIHDIEYSLSEDANKYRRDEYLKLVSQLPDEQGQSKDVMDRLHGGHHHEHYKWWHYALVFPWAWKSFIHAKHEAFAFKYDPEIMLHLEKKEMKPIRRMMFFWSIMYFIILFALPFVFKQPYCGGLFYNELYVIYAVYALLNGIWEVYVVLRIQNQIHQETTPKRAKKLLDFNRWHVVELFMGQIARFDTFLDFLFIVIIADCGWEFKYFLVPSSIYMFLMQCFPIYMLTKIAFNKGHHLEHTMPLMESNNFLSFLRENMLLATVVDSFCINNNKSFLKKYKNKKGQKGVHIVFGRMMGGLSFLLQDFPQFTIHACFKIFVYTPLHYHLKKKVLLLVSMVVSFAAVLISFFNMVMCADHEFDPVLLEAALYKRRQEFEKDDKEKRLQEQDKLEAQRKEARKQAFKQRMRDGFRKKIMMDADEEEARAVKSFIQVDINQKPDSKLLGRFKLKAEINKTLIQQSKTDAKKKTKHYKQDKTIINNQDETPLLRVTTNDEQILKPHLVDAVTTENMVTEPQMNHVPNISIDNSEKDAFMANEVEVSDVNPQNSNFVLGSADFSSPEQNEKFHLPPISPTRQPNAPSAPYEIIEDNEDMSQSDQANADHEPITSDNKDGKDSKINRVHIM